MFICLYVYKRVDIIMMIICYASDVMRRTLELSYELLHIEKVPAV